ncbi:RNA-directed DNA polymerase, eukaryota [Tanacetum coccineum]
MSSRLPQLSSGGESSLAKSRGDFFTVDGVPEEPDAAVVSSMTITRLAVAVNMALPYNPLDNVQAYWISTKRSYNRGINNDVTFRLCRNPAILDGYFILNELSPGVRLTKFKKCSFIFQWVWRSFRMAGVVGIPSSKLCLVIHGDIGSKVKRIGIIWLYALEESKSISVADKLGLSSLYLSFRRPPRGGIEQESFNLLCQSVRGLVLSNIEDRWSWSLEGSGLFSVKSSRAYIDDLLLPKADAATRWIRILPIKINVFAWKVCLDALPTRCNMSLRGIDIPSILCPLCNRAVENSDHIFFSCSMVRKVWRRLLTWWELDVSSFHSYNEWISWLSSIRLPKLLKVFLEGSCYVMWWLVWKFRNHLLFSDPTSKPDSLFDDVV